MFHNCSFPVTMFVYINTEYWPEHSFSYFCRLNMQRLNKNFACAGQLIITTPTQAVKLPTTTVTRLPSPFDKNELELRNVEFLQLKKLL